jgi:hypothetical protein
MLLIIDVTNRRNIIIYLLFVTHEQSFNLGSMDECYEGDYIKLVENIMI